MFMICTSLVFSTRTFGVPLGALSASGPNVLLRIVTSAAFVMVIAGPTGQFHPKTLGVVPKPVNELPSIRMFVLSCEMFSGASLTMGLVPGTPESGDAPMTTLG